MLDTNKIFPIGIGTWGIGGFAEKNPQNDDQKQIDALVHFLKKGANYIQIPYWYAEGYAAELLKRAIDLSGKKREELFITSSIYPDRNPGLEDANREFETLLNILDTKYLDGFVVALRALPRWGESETKKYIHELIEKGKTRFVSVTNYNLDSLKNFKKEFGDKLFSHEISLSFEIRENVDFGIVKFADENGIRNVISQPLRRNRSAAWNWPLLVELSEKYKVTQNQVILAWMVRKGFLPITKSETASHIDEHIISIDIDLSESDLGRIDSFRPDGWMTPQIDWYQTGEGVRIDQLANIFDETFKKQ